MIESLLIENLSIIRRTRISPETGLSAITGESGAGKSQIVNAVRLLTGRRTQSVKVRNDASAADVTLSASLVDAPEARAWLKANRPELADAERVTLRRTMPTKGRAEARLNDKPLALAKLAELADTLVEICGQNSHQALLQTERHLEILDNQCGHTAAVAEMAALARGWRATHKRLEEARRELGASTERRALLEYQVSELDELAVEENEWETLDVEHRTLSRGEQLAQTCGRALDALGADESGVQSGLARLARDFEPFDAPKLKAVSAQIEEALVILESASSDLRALIDGADWSEQRLHEVDARLTRLSEVARKHKVEPAKLHARYQELRDELKRLERSESAPAELEKEAAALHEQWREHAEKIGAKRRKTAAAMAKKVEAALKRLAMPDAVFQTLFEPVGDAEPDPRGLERATFLVRTTPGSKPAPLKEVASGGEVSRISLALRAVLAEKYPVPTLIFDEVDSGVGGATAETVGAMLKRMSEHSQVLCITHLPQVASQAGRHYRVEKHSSAKETDIALTELKRPQREREIARMMAGEVITKRSLAHAEELLDRHAESVSKSTSGPRKAVRSSHL